MERPEQEKLLFHSFMHSQGDFDLQRNIIQFVLHKTDVDLRETAKTCDTGLYLKYLQSHKQHVSRTPVGPIGTQTETLILIDEIKDQFSRLEPSPGTPKIAEPIETTIKKIASTVILLDKTYIREGASEKSRPAIRKRLLGHRPSFLLYYGRDGHSTTFPVFNEMYRLAWDHRPRVQAFGLQTLVRRSVSKANRNTTFLI